MLSRMPSPFKMIRNIAAAVTLGAVLAGCQSMSAGTGLDADNTSYKRMVTQGPATKIINPNIYPDCPQHNPRMNIRKSAVGQITATDGTVITCLLYTSPSPYTMAFLLVDWDEHLGLGMEQFPVPVTPATSQWYPGDGGLIARFSDGTMTDSSWKAQTFFIAPLVDPKEVVERGNIHDTPNLGGRTHPFARKPDCREKCYAVHYPIPENWQSPRFNDTNWPRAWEFTDQEIGVTALPAYTRYPELFDGARWIWTQNLVLDNVVIARKTVR